MTTSSSSQSVRAVAWDPKSPSTLLIASCDDPEKNSELHVDTFSSDDGVGCNRHERSALMKLITSASNENDDMTIKGTSLSYRKALNECLEGWEADDTLEDAEGLELLKLVYAVTQLSDIFLLLPQPSLDTFEQDLWSTPGAVTADTVRYLRLNHMGDPYDIVGEGLEDLLQSSQPDLYGAVYWKLVQTLVLRGCLEDAWALLSRHFLCQRAFAKTEILDGYHTATIEQDREGFLALRALLLTAPLPGGRNEWNDACLEGDDDEPQGDAVVLMDGVPRDSYKLWDAASATSDLDAPLSFDPHAALAMHKAWRREVVDNPSLQGLLRRIPELQTNVLAVLSGSFDTVVFSSWSEALCAELLYQRPGLCPKDMNVRTARLMQSLGASINVGFDEVVLSVMKGDAGRVVEVLHQCGGGSGAALPATMTSLLCNLLTDAEQIPLPDPSSSFHIQTELLLSASQALLSSLSTSEPDLGVRLSTKLLLPYVKPNGDVRITATLGETLERHGPNTDSQARVLLELCRDLVARKSRRVLDGCLGLIIFRYRHYLSERRSGGAVHWLLKGLELETLMYATTDGRRDDHALQTVLASGSCGTLLSSYCGTAAKSLLSCLVADDEKTTVGRSYAQAMEMVESIQDDDPSGLALKMSDVKLLFGVFEIARAIVDDEDDSVIAKGIIMCLDDNIDDEDDGIVHCLAHYSMYGDLLKLAHKILQRDEESEENGSVGDDKYKSSFDVNGIRALLERFTQVTLAGDAMTSSTISQVVPMRLALGKGLMRAIVAENAKRKAIHLGPTSRRELGSAYSSKLNSYSRSDQEQIVKLMLDPSM